MIWEEPISASKIVNIAHQRTLGLLLSNCYCLFLNRYILTSPHMFNCIWSYRTPIQAKFVSLERYDMRLQVLWFEKNLFLPLRLSKSLINEHLGCYCPTVTVCFWTVTFWPLLICLTISGVIELRFKRNLCRWKDKTWGYKFYDLSRTHFCL